MSEPGETIFPILPDRVEWRGPGGYVIVLDEDGVNLHPGTSALKAVELDRLLAIIDAAAQFRLDNLADDIVRAFEKKLDRGRF